MSPKYLSDIIPSTTRRYSSRNANNIPLVRVNKNYFINTFFASMERTWINLTWVFVIQLALMYLKVDYYNL